MTLGKMCPDFFSRVKKRARLKRKVIEMELAWREHEREQGIWPSCSFSEAIERGMRLWV